MKRILLAPLAIVLLGHAALAGDQLRNVQTELKNLGFFYGTVDGQENTETTAAVRRYQIRNGLEVTGTLTPETLSALGMGAAKTAPKPTAPTAPPSAPAPAVKPKPPVDLRRGDSVEQKDRDFLQREDSRQRPLQQPDSRMGRDPSVINPPVPLEAPSPDFPVLFSGTPYSRAPAVVQQQTLKRAQAVLASRGFYHDIVDGLPGPATEEALLTFQRSARLTLTGRLDLETLNELRLLPGTTASSTDDEDREEQREDRRRTLRGVWIFRR